VSSITHAIAGVARMITAPLTAHFERYNAGLLLEQKKGAVISIINAIVGEVSRPVDVGPVTTGAPTALIAFTAVCRAAALSSARSRDPRTPRCMFVGDYRSARQNKDASCRVCVLKHRDKLLRRSHG